ncbi:MAG: hypothetical protein AAGA56_03145 [Myxococcota bacterium]
MPHLHPAPSLEAVLQHAEAHAQRFCDDSGFTEPFRDMVVTVLVGAAAICPTDLRARPRWSKIPVHPYLDELDAMVGYDDEAFAVSVMILIGFYEWLAERRVIRAHKAAKILRKLRTRLPVAGSGTPPLFN